MTSPKVHAIITAAGSSRRMGGIDKLTLPIDGTPLLVRTLQPFLEHKAHGEVVVTVNPERVSEFRSLIQAHLGSTTIHVTAGGAHRQESILFGLRLLREICEPASDDQVMIHDGARPFVTTNLFDRLLEKLDEFDGVIPALPVRDTVKKVQGSKVVSTIDRETLRLVQTPQVFHLNSITELHEKAHREEFLGTDDASLLERYGLKVGWIEGPIYNLKVTLPEDVAMINYLFRQTEAP